MMQYGGKYATVKGVPLLGKPPKVFYINRDTKRRFARVNGRSYAGFL
jgi:hypothetical protein